MTAALVARLYEADGQTLVRTLNCSRVEVSASRRRAVRRTATLEVAPDDAADLRKLGRLIRIHDPQVGSGYQGWQELVRLEMRDGDLSSWSKGGNGTISYIEDSTAGYWAVARCTGYVWLTYPTHIPFDPQALYRYRVRVRQVSDPTDGTSKGMYAGLSGYAQDGSSLYTCGPAGGGSYYITLAGHKLTAGSGWAEYTGYLRGTGRVTGTAWDEDRPGRAYPGCKYIRPLIAVNHAYGDGVADIDYIALEVEARTGQVFEGYVDDLREVHRPEGVTIEVTCRDRSKRLQLDRWTEHKTYEDTGASEGTQLIVSVSASSELAAGSEIQSQARVGTRTLRATVAGIAREVAPDSEAGSIVDGDYSVNYTAPGLSQLELTQVLDLCAGEDLQAVIAAAAGNVQPDPHFDQGMTGKSFYNWGGLGTVSVTTGVCLLDNSAEPTEPLALITQ